jgi:phosphoribosylaminoimidazole carboxylase PurE protein
MKIAIIMGSDSDWPIMKAAAEILSEFEVEHQAKVVSAHRTPDDMVAFAKSAESEGFSVIIAGAGGAAHLPGMVASCTTLPVIGVPIAGSTQKLDGMDSLLSIVQMPKGIPVATVAINNATNAALLAIRMLAISDKDIRAKVAEYAVAMAETSRAKTLN